MSLQIHPYTIYMMYLKYVFKTSGLITIKISDAVNFIYRVSDELEKKDILSDIYTSNVRGFIENWFNQVEGENTFEATWSFIKSTKSHIQNGLEPELKEVLFKFISEDLNAKSKQEQEDIFNKGKESLDKCRAKHFENYKKIEKVYDDFANQSVK